MGRMRRSCRRSIPRRWCCRRPRDTTTLVTEADTQSRMGSSLVLDGNVVVTYRDRRVEADHIEYDKETGELTATGHLKATGGANNEIITASHGTMNLRTQTGRFYDVTGSVGLKTVEQQDGVYERQSVSVYGPDGGEDGTAGV